MPRILLRGRGYAELGASAIECGTLVSVPSSPPPPPPRKRTLAQRAQAARLRRYGAKLATAFRPDALKFTPDAYAFGDDATPMTEEQWRAKMLTETQGQSQWLERWVKRDEMQRWIQIAATLAIPLSAAIWRAIFRATRRDT